MDLSLIALAAALAPLPCAVLLAVTGAGKLPVHRVRRAAAGTVLVRLPGGPATATAVLRAVGAAELLLSCGLLATGRASTPVPAAATALLGAAFIVYLGQVRRTAPAASCGCSGRDEGPVGVRAFVRAGALLAGGIAALSARHDWWTAAAARPLAATVLLAAAGAGCALLGAGRLPLLRLQLRLLGHPLAGSGQQGVPVAASVELLERSLAWQTAGPVVRSALLEHWDADGWRVLRFSGVHGQGEAARPVSVLFALDPAHTVDSTPAPSVRLAVVDEHTGRPLPVPEQAAVGTW
ncbi:MauE/DoxX family redox-associated membrane protein [Streptomyces sp. NPDC058045]|uniref:MauE/DoxX family redox-associated membrane protein n=1 Tax=Streptomyces sp. NPDC058045 TaxID=3346311 RepID=UPI0036E41441